ncbi:MAG: C4-dicarboxylate transport protein, partial [Methylocystaceae bacterium]
MLRSISIPAGKRATPAVSSAPSRTKKPLYRHLYVQVLAAIALGALFGWLAPHAAAQDWVKALGDGFVKLIKM